MDYEKKYKEALEMAKVAALNGHQNLMEGIFPELRKSKDEKTRKEIVGYLKKNLRYEWATWLEKQGTSYTKRDVDDAYVEGMAFAKDELEKQKPTWSEEDEVRLQTCIDTLQAKSIMGKVDTIQTNWLESIKQRYTWKPSDEQMEVLVWCRPLFIVPKLKGILESLINDLKKLKGE